MFVFPCCPPFRTRVSHHFDRAPFPLPAHRTGRARLRHPALGQGSTPRRVGLVTGRGTPPGGPEPFAEVIGFRHSPGSHAPSDALLELGSLPSTGITRLPRYYEPVRHPRWPGLALAGLRLRVGPRTAWGFPCCCGSPCADMPPPLPRWDPWGVSRHEGYSPRVPKD